MINTNQFINSLSRYFKCKIVMFDEDSIKLKSNVKLSKYENNLQTPRIEKRQTILSYSHPIIYKKDENPSYIFVPVYANTSSKHGVLWLFNNENKFFENINDDKLNFITTLSEEICFSYSYKEIENSKKVYAGILESLKDNTKIELSIFSDEQTVISKKNILKKDNFTNVISKNFYSNGNFIGGFIANYSKAGFTNKELSNHNITFQSEKYNNIIGKNPQLIQVLKTINQVAKTDSTVLLRGESGTGKEQFAKIIHSESNRSKEPFIAINCAAIPENLLESELFGYEKGSFTGANKFGKVGKIELANKGTLFLDEIGDMSFTVQVKLLRVIQERCIERIGGNQLIPVDIRIISATNKNLEDMIATEEFREDLYYRINVIPIFLSSLTNKHNDIELLLNHYLKKYCILQKKKFMNFSFEALEFLKSYRWPGNIRELINTVEYCVTMSNKETITLDDLPKQLSVSDVKTKSVSKKKSQMTREEFLNLLEKYGNTTKDKKKLAAHLNVSLATLYRWIEKYSK